MKSAAMSTTFGSLNPASASGTVSTPQRGRATRASNATTSIRGLLATNRATHPPSKPRTSSSCGFTRPPPLQSSEQYDREHLRGKDAQERGQRIDGGVRHGRRVGAGDVGSEGERG